MCIAGTEPGSVRLTSSYVRTSTGTSYVPSCTEHTVNTICTCSKEIDQLINLELATPVSFVSPVIDTFRQQISQMITKSTDCL
jgi:hypothetical protein